METKVMPFFTYHIITDVWLMQKGSIAESSYRSFLQYFCTTLSNHLFLKSKKGVCAQNPQKVCRERKEGYFCELYLCVFYRHTKIERNKMGVFVKHYLCPLPTSCQILSLYLFWFKSYGYLTFDLER